MSSWWAKDDTRDPKEGRDGGPKTITPEHKKIKQKLINTKQIGT